MKHQMKLKTSPFYLIKGGHKDIEMRLYDDKRRDIKIGDIIEFTNIDNEEKISAVVKNLYVEPSFESLYAKFDKVRLGYQEDSDAKASDMLEYYPQQEQDKCGVVGIELELIKKSPIIGIVAKSVDYEVNGRVWYDQTVCGEVRNMVVHNGGLAISLLPVLDTMDFSHTDEGNLPMNLSDNDKELIKSQIALCDGIILQGGEFSDPFEEWIAKYCFDIDKPTLGICAGYNNMIRGLGGLTLKHEDLEIHKRPDLEYAHKVKVDTHSKLFTIVKEECFDTNSMHEYKADKLKDLTACAWSEEGFIEAVENVNKKFFVGVKFHPEYLYKKDEIHNKIAQAFIDACRQILF